MNRSLFLVITVLFFFGGASFSVLADEAGCGAPPTLPTTAENAESIKGELRGEANLLTKWVGKAELAGQIEAAKKNIYQSSDKFFAAQKDAYLSYIFCVVVMGDKSLSGKDKIDAIIKYKNTITNNQTGAYNWRRDAERLSYIYSGQAFCDKKNINISECLNSRVGSFRLKPEKKDFETTLTITEKKIAIRQQEFKENIQNRDIRAEADLVDLKPLAAYVRGNYYDGTESNSLRLECLAGECFRWTGWQYHSPMPGKVERAIYNGDSVMSGMFIALAQNIDSELKLEMQRILARLISEDHSDGGLIACALLCGADSCSSSTDSCEKMLYR